jgi:putative Ca2+/H+ antiporter (TMEM165/GDT1 family)
MTSGFANTQFWYVALAAYWMVLVAELVGDRSIYTVGALALRFRGPIVFCGLLAAFTGKMLVAVMLGSTIARFQSRWTDLLSAGAFFLSSALIWFAEPPEGKSNCGSRVHWLRATGICFSSLFCAEWGDPGQISIAALTVKTHSLAAPWLGGTLAMMTKGTLAMALGLELRERVPQRTLRALASASCCVLGIVALGGTVLR